MIFNKRKAAPVVNGAKVIALVKVLMDQKMMKYEDSVFYIYKQLVIGKDRKNVIKNIFFYARLKNIISEKDTIYIKDMEEPHKLIAIHNNKHGTKYL